MEIVTQSLLLREFAEHDLPAFLAYHADRKYAEYYAPDEAQADYTRALFRMFRRWAIERPRQNYQVAAAQLSEPGELIGCCGLRREGLRAGRAEFGIELAPRFWDRGFGAEAARAILEFGFRELALDDVRAVSVSANVRITRLLRRLGFTVVGTRVGPDWMHARGWSQTEWRIRPGGLMDAALVQLVEGATVEVRPDPAVSRRRVP